LGLRFYCFFDGIFLAEMGILFIINAKTLVNNIRMYYEKYFKQDFLFMKVTLIISSISYLLRATYLLSGFIFFKDGIKQLEEIISLQHNKILMFIGILLIVCLTELFPILALILTNAFILKQKSMKMKSIGEKDTNILEDVSSANESEEIEEIDEDNKEIRQRVRNIRSLIINEFIDKDETHPEYNYQMKNKQAGREIFWTYHFFEYIDDYIDQGPQSETSISKEATKDQEMEATVNFALMTDFRKQQRENSKKQERKSSRKRKKIVKNLEQEEEER
jgi:hypothetical protein